MIKKFENFKPTFLCTNHKLVQKIYNEKIHHTVNGHLFYIFHQKNKERINLSL